jgi:type IV pilus assembly protein PilP
MIMYAIKKALPLMAVLFAIAGCSGGTKATSPKATAAQPKTAATVTTAPTATVVAVTEPYSYVPGGRRDPFTPIVIKEEKKAVLGAKTPLERFPINEFKLAGIVWGGLGYHAMLEGPDGKGYFVRQGTIIGPNRGVVKKITQNSMIIEEKFKDPTGELNKHEIVIELRKSQEGTP